MTAGESGKIAEVPSRLPVSTMLVRPGEIRVSIHRTMRFDSEFVRLSLMRVFNKSAQEAQVILKTVEMAGSAYCGTYSRQVAETKVDEVRSQALRRQTKVDMRLSRNDASKNVAN